MDKGPGRVEGAGSEMLRGEQVLSTARMGSPSQSSSKGAATVAVAQAAMGYIVHREFKSSNKTN